MDFYITTHECTDVHNVFYWLVDFLFFLYYVLELVGMLKNKEVKRMSDLGVITH